MSAATTEAACAEADSRTALAKIIDVAKWDWPGIVRMAQMEQSDWSGRWRLQQGDAAAILRLNDAIEAARAVLAAAPDDAPSREWYVERARAVIVAAMREFPEKCLTFTADAPGVFRCTSASEGATPTSDERDRLLHDAHRIICDLGKSDWGMVTKAMHEAGRRWTEAYNAHAYAEVLRKHPVRQRCETSCLSFSADALGVFRCTVCGWPDQSP